MLQFQSVSLRRGTRLLFNQASFNVHPKQRVGLSGANGTGKSSLFALIKGEIQTDEGDFLIPKDWVIAHVAQETPDDPRSALDYVLDGDVELRQIEEQLIDAENNDNGTQIAHLHHRLDVIEGYSAKSRAAQLIHGLGFQTEEEYQSVKTFSGGWRMRLNLARALMCRSDLLLLDEPTNHLDLDAVIWLEEWLKTYAGTLLLISHDRDFLDSVVNHIAHIEQERVTLYTGNYTDFERIRAEKLALQQASFEKQQREISHIQGYIDRFRAQATKARQAQSRIKALERMEKIAAAHVDSPFSFEFKQPDKQPDPLIKLESVSAGYDDHIILNHIDLVISPGDRIGLLGPNGAGKSTLIKLLAGELPAKMGEITFAQELNVGYFAQHQLDQLQPDQTPLEHLQQLDKTVREQTLKDYLGGFGFQGDRVDSVIAPFSGGEKARLVLALLVYQKPNLLLLDEPTNHLDLDMRLALSLALQNFEGAMLIVSHDRHLLRSTCDQLLLVYQQRTEEFSGDLDDYPKWLADNKPSQMKDSDKVTQSENASDRKIRKQQEAEERKKLQPLKNKLKKFERDIEQLSEKQGVFEEQLADPCLYERDNKSKLTRLLLEKANVDRLLASAEEDWMLVGEQLEDIQVYS